MFNSSKEYLSCRNGDEALLPERDEIKCEEKVEDFFPHSLTLLLSGVRNERPEQ